MVRDYQAKFAGYRQGSQCDSGRRCAPTVSGKRANSSAKPKRWRRRSRKTRSFLADQEVKIARQKIARRDGRSGRSHARANCCGAIFRRRSRPFGGRLYSKYRTDAMIEGSLARRYTKALFQLAREAGQEEKIGQEIEQFYAAYSGSELQDSVDESGVRRRQPQENSHSGCATPATVGAVDSLSVACCWSATGSPTCPASSAAIAACSTRPRGESRPRSSAPPRLMPALVERLREQLRGISGKEVVLAARDRSKPARRPVGRAGRQGLRRQRAHPA